MRFLCGILTVASLVFCVIPAFADIRKDNADCATTDYERAIAGCTRVIKTSGMPLQNKLVAHSNIANLLIGKGDLSAALL